MVSFLRRNSINIGMIIPMTCKFIVVLHVIVLRILLGYLSDLYALNIQTNDCETDARESSWLPVLRLPSWRITWATCNDVGCSEQNRVRKASYKLRTQWGPYNCELLQRDHVHLALGNFDDGIIRRMLSERYACCYMQLQHYHCSLILDISKESSWYFY